MSTVTHTNDHLADAEIMQLVDGEGSPAERTRWSAHAGHCRLCAGQAEALRGDGAVVREWLERAAFEEDVEVADAHAAAAGRPAAGDTSRRRSADTAGRSRPSAGQGLAPWMRAAAVVLLVAAPVAAIPSLRDFVVHTLGDRGVDRPAMDAAAPAAAHAATTVRFVPDAGAFTVRVDAVQQGGTLSVRYGRSGDAVLHTPGDPGAGPVVSARALRLRNDATAHGSYVLELPATITRVNVQVGAGTPRSLDAAMLQTGTEVPLH
ncbi:MAG TPA: hypothetical protein VK936_05180 [Longimicrobiales bacterium]|nr:hypothetical protein [Longimicrobiales bacterium]